MVVLNQKVECTENVMFLIFLAFIIIIIYSWTKFHLSIRRDVDGTGSVGGKTDEIRKMKEFSAVVIEKKPEQ